MLLNLESVPSLASSSEDCTLTENNLDASRSLSCQIRGETCKALLPAEVHGDIQDFCAPQDQRPTSGQTFLQCLRMLPEPTLDLIRGIARSSAQQRAQLQERINECKTSPAMRENLEALVPIATGATRRLPCENLVIEWQDLVRRERISSLDARAQDYSRRMQVHRGGTSSASFMENLSTWLGREREQIQCLNSEALTHLWCYRMFSIVDPLLIAGFSLKALRLTRALRPATVGESPAPLGRGTPSSVRSGSPAPAAGPLPRNPQVEVWRLREAGQSEAADALEGQIRGTLQTGAITRSRPVGGINVFGRNFGGHPEARIVRFENGVEGIWKPHSEYGGNSMYAETTAHLIDRHLGMNQVPITVERQINGVDGSIQLRVSDLNPRAAAVSEPRSLAVFDYLIQNWDRKNASNSLVTREGRVVGIDHGLAFSPNYVPGAPEKIDDILSRANGSAPAVNRSSPRASAIQNLSEEEGRRYLALTEIQELNLDRTAIDRLRRTSPEDWRRITGNRLSPEDYERLVERQRRLIQAVDSAERTLGPGIYRGGPFTPLEFFPRP